MTPQISSRINPTQPSLIPISSSVIPPVLKPQNPDFYYVNLTLKMSWKEFCDLEDEFRDGVAQLLSAETNDPFVADQIFIMNKQDCQSNENAVLKFYVSGENGKNTPDRESTELAVKLLQRLVEEQKTAELGPQFAGKVCLVMIFGYIRNQQVP